MYCILKAVIRTMRNNSHEIVPVNFLFKIQVLQKNQGYISICILTVKGSYDYIISFCQIFVAIYQILYYIVLMKDLVSLDLVLYVIQMINKTKTKSYNVKQLQVMILYLQESFKIAFRAGIFLFGIPCINLY